MEELEYKGKRYRVALRITPTTRLQACTACSASIPVYTEEVTPTLVEELSVGGEVARKLDPDSCEAAPIARQARINFVIRHSPSGGAAAQLCDHCVSPVPS